jgi:hypothetical protein
MDLVGRLPGDYQWHLNITEDDDDTSPASLNIFFLPGGDDWGSLMVSLRLGIPSDRGEDFVSWTRGMLTVSLIEHQQEEEDDREPDA